MDGFEVQVLGDEKGNRIHLGERECSLQFRYQKIIEEAPCAALSVPARERLHNYAMRIADDLDYLSLGTVEFLYDVARDEVFFLEVNARVQVEHPVTETVTGVDLVRCQILAAFGEELEIRQGDVVTAGHAIEARLECEAVEVAVAVARKLAPTLIVREPFAEISALASDCFRQLISAPHIVVRVNDAVYATAKEKLDDIARARTFEGRLVVLAEPDVALGDCRVEWADGGINRDSASANAVIGEAVTGYIGARRNFAGLEPRRSAPEMQETPSPASDPHDTRSSRAAERLRPSRWLGKARATTASRGRS